jgi:acetyltransferase-like isoleucine patch superfamily enzyme
VASAEQLVLPPGVSMGRHSFGYHVDTFQLFRPSARIEVGAFCSIQREARILAGSDHLTGRASTFPFNAKMFAPERGNLEEAVDPGPTIIGSDVWIGLGAIVLAGVMVGDGAVIGAGALVSKHVPAYAVVGGNPAEIIRYRFEEDLRRRLLALRWWEWDDTELAGVSRWLTGDVEAFVQEMERTHERSPPSELMRRLAAASPEHTTPHRRRETP